MILCPKCTEPNSDDNLYCKKCGRELGEHLSKSKNQTQSREFDKPQEQYYHNPESSYNGDEVERIRAGYGIGLTGPRKPKLRSRNDRIHPGLFFLAAIVPFFGFILYFFLRADKPVSAGFALRAGILNFFLWIVLGLF